MVESNAACSMTLEPDERHNPCEWRRVQGARYYRVYVKSVRSWTFAQRANPPNPPLEKGGSAKRGGICTRGICTLLAWTHYYGVPLGACTNLLWSDLGLWPWLTSSDKVQGNQAKGQHDKAAKNNAIHKLRCFSDSSTEENSTYPSLSLSIARFVNLCQSYTAPMMKSPVSKRISLQCSPRANSRRSTSLSPVSGGK